METKQDVILAQVGHRMDDLRNKHGARGLRRSVCGGVTIEGINFGQLALEALGVRFDQSMVVTDRNNGMFGLFFHAGNEVARWNLPKAELTICTRLDSGNEPLRVVRQRQDFGYIPAHTGGSGCDAVHTGGSHATA